MMFIQSAATAGENVICSETSVDSLAQAWWLDRARRSGVPWCLVVKGMI
jgi:hypothetical protein